MSLKKSIRGVIRMAGYDIKNIKRAREEAAAAPRPEPAGTPELKAEEKPLPVDVLDLALQDLMRRQPHIEFVQIGAHDGVTYDPIYPYISKHGWTGVVVEPQPRIFARLSANHASHKGVRLENCAITTRDGETELFIFAENASLPYHATMLASLNRDALAHNGHGYVGEILSVKVPTMTPTSLLKKHGVKNVDVLQIDTEGHDYVILLEFLKAEIFPQLIHFESAFCDHEQFKTYCRALAKAKYRVTAMGIDTVAYRQSEEGSFEERAPLSRLN